ncbi:MAG: glycoside hydrolase family 2 [Planctomycetes bacterium]|nr:glycoside hydrolase family 2 [Planctomycetota bacterium]MBL7143046.1 glycoside hydrolase family 2 [Phycisphaerae bacterium]
MRTGPADLFRTFLTSWKIQSGDQLSACGDNISTAGFESDTWYEAWVPSTVLASLVDQGQYKDLYFGKNLNDVPRERFEQPWWYRNEFVVKGDDARAVTLLEFDGINYAANIWLNGRQVADTKQVYGAFRQFWFNVSEFVKKGDNVLAVEVVPPGPGDFSTGFVDWNPPAPDRNMGIFRPVKLHHCKNISVDNPFIRTDLDTDKLDSADLTVSAELTNHSSQSVTGVLVGSIEAINFETSVTLSAGEQKTITFTPEHYKELVINQPRLWWPSEIGEPNLYNLRLEFVLDGEICDECQTAFGIRRVEDYFNEQGHRGYKVNGRKVLIKAAGWSDDMLLSDTPEKLEAQIRYVKHMNLNCIRLEGIWGKDHTLYDLCDRYGILMMVGWSCHWEHEQYLGKPVDERFGGIASPEDIDLMAKSWNDQVIWLRNHPSILVWAIGSDKIPHPLLECRYIATFEKYDPGRPYLASTGGVGSEQAIIGSDVIVSDISGPTGVKMLGPYAYTPPLYWYEDKNRGGAYGFNTETGPGAQVPVLESLKKMIPAGHLWPIDEYWDFHCGLNEFSNLDRFCEALEKRYGPADNIEQFAYKAQIMNYELVRPMFEAFRVNEGIATGVVQWMLNAAWPKMYWQLYDWYMNPNGAFYGTKKACEPLQLIYNYSSRSVFLVNSARSSSENLTAEIRIFDLHSNKIFHKKQTLCTGPQSSKEIFTLPDFPGITATYFLDMRIIEKDGTQIASNFYWLSTKSDVLDYQAKVDPWEYYTPSKQYADFTLLNSLSPTTLTMRREIQTDNNRLTIELENVGENIAFAVKLDIIDDKTGEAVVPVFWQDNYIALLPDERRTIHAEFNKNASNIKLDVQGWNAEVK